MKNNTAAVQGLIILCGFIFLAFQGCGMKLPPLPPDIKGQAIAAPFDLKYTLGEKGIELSWKHATDKETANVKPEGFDIFMAQKTFDACEGCPFVFKKVGFVSMPARHFVKDIKKGFKYYFRVQATGRDNMKSEFSKTVQLEYK